MRSKSRIMELKDLPEAITLLMSATTRSTSWRALASVSASTGIGAVATRQAARPPARTSRRSGSFIIGVLQRSSVGIVIGVQIIIAGLGAQFKPAILQVERARLCVAVRTVVKDRVDRIGETTTVRQAGGHRSRCSVIIFGIVQHIGQRIGEKIDNLAPCVTLG